jgi:hypothetical protein
MIFVISIESASRKVMSEKWPEEKKFELEAKVRTF